MFVQTRQRIVHLVHSDVRAALATPRRPFMSGFAGSKKRGAATSAAVVPSPRAAVQTVGSVSAASSSTAVVDVFGKHTRGKNNRGIVEGGSTTFSHIQQKPLFPGMYRHVKRFSGEYVYHYGKHSFAIFKESLALVTVPAGCVVAYLVTLFPSIPAIPFVYQAVYMVGLLGLSRWVASGRKNHIWKDLRGRHVVITGATSGIGLATALQLANQGADITVLSRDTPRGLAAVEMIKKASAIAQEKHLKAHARGSEEGAAVIAAAAAAAAAGTPYEHSLATRAPVIKFQALDLADFIAVREYCKRARRQGRGVDILVNNAGVLQQHHIVTRFGDDVQLAINYLGPYLLTEGLLPLVEAAQGRIVYVTCSAHVGIKGNIVNTYLTGRGVWSPRVANTFDGLEQYGFTKLGSIYHTQDLAARAYPEPPKQRIAARLTAQKDPKLRPGTAAMTAAEHAEQRQIEPRYTTCACTPGGVVTNLYRDVPLSGIFRYCYYAVLLVMRTPREGSQVVVNCAMRDELCNGGYYMNGRYEPQGLSKAACDVTERQQVMAWTQTKMRPYMKWD